MTAGPVFRQVPELSREAAYRGFYVPHFEIRVAGASLPATVNADVAQITYKDDVKEIDSVDITLNNWDEARRRFRYIGSETEDDLPGGRHPDPDATLFEPGSRRMEVWLGYVGALRLVSTVNVVSLEPSFSGGPATLQVRGLNVLSRLRKAQHSHAWYGETPSRIARALGRLTDGKGQRRFPVPIEIDEKAAAREAAIPFLAQDNEYDVDFLLNLARRVGYEVVLEDDPERILFVPSARSGARADYRLVWGETLIDFKPRLTTARQVAKVTVRGWDRATKKPINVTVDTKDGEVRRVNRDLHRLVEEAGGREEMVVDEPVSSEQEARQRARAIMLDQMKQIVTAEGSTVGLPDLRAGSLLEIAGVGARLSGRYFVTGTTHAFSDQGYVTRFKARREQDGGRR